MNSADGKRRVSTRRTLMTRPRRTTRCSTRSRRAPHARPSPAASRRVTPAHPRRLTSIWRRALPSPLPARRPPQPPPRRRPLPRRRSLPRSSSSSSSSSSSQATRLAARPATRPAIPPCRLPLASLRHLPMLSRRQPPPHPLRPRPPASPPSSRPLTCPPHPPTPRPIRTARPRPTILQHTCLAAYRLFTRLRATAATAVPTVLVSPATVATSARVDMLPMAAQPIRLSRARVWPWAWVLPPPCPRRSCLRSRRRHTCSLPRMCRWRHRRPPLICRCPPRISAEPNRPHRSSLASSAAYADSLLPSPAPQHRQLLRSQDRRRRRRLTAMGSMVACHR